MGSVSYTHLVNGWEKFTIRDWIRLLYDQPKFIKKVKETKIIEKFSYYDWKDLCDYANYNNESYRPIFEDLAKNYLYGILSVSYTHLDIPQAF